MKMNILDCNQIKKKQIKKRIWIVIKLRFNFINLEIIGEEDKKKNYIYLKKKNL